MLLLMWPAVRCHVAMFVRANFLDEHDVEQPQRHLQQHDRPPLRFKRAVICRSDDTVLIP
jgi:hypothetical protein